MINEPPTLTQEEANDLEGNISVEEATCFEKKMTNGKKPWIWWFHSIFI